MDSPFGKAYLYPQVCKPLWIEGLNLPLEKGGRGDFRTHLPFYSLKYVDKPFKSPFIPLLKGGNDLFSQYPQICGQRLVIKGGHRADKGIFLGFG